MIINNNNRNNNSNDADDDNARIVALCNLSALNDVKCTQGSIIIICIVAYNSSKIKS